MHSALPHALPHSYRHRNGGGGGGGGGGGRRLKSPSPHNKTPSYTSA